MLAAVPASFVARTVPRGDLKQEERLGSIVGIRRLYQSWYRDGSGLSFGSYGSVSFFDPLEDLATGGPFTPEGVLIDLVLHRFFDGHVAFDPAAGHRNLFVEHNVEG
jgi:hypothetical protein